MTQDMTDNTSSRPVWKEKLLGFAMSLGAPIIVGALSAIISMYMMTGKLETRVDHLEVQIERHEKALDRDFLRHEQVVATLSNKTDDQERRLTRLEALVNETQNLLAEIRSDIKTLLRGSAPLQGNPLPQRSSP